MTTVTVSLSNEEMRRLEELSKRRVPLHKTTGSPAARA